MMTATLLGCGSSGGVPRIGNNWGDCDPNNPKNRRTRCSLLVACTDKHGGVVQMLIDTSPDLREQCLRHNIATVDAVAYTHDHADQSHGIDELRSIYQNRGNAPIPVWMSKETAQTLMPRFSYCFSSNEQGYPPILSAQVLENFAACFTVKETLRVETFHVRHGPLNSLGFKISTSDKNIVYTPDMHDIPEESRSFIQSADVWIVDCFGYRPHPTHAHLDLVLRWVGELSPAMTVLTNLHTTMDYAALSEKVFALRKDVHVGFDGLQIKI